jgi:hypothetical protein
VLEGLPLTILISILIIAVGASLLLSIYELARMSTIGNVYVSVAGATVSGFLPASPPTQLVVHVLAQSGGAMANVMVVLNGSGVGLSGATSPNGSVYFWVVPVLHNHAASGTLSVQATYTGGVSFSTPARQSFTTTLVVLS